MAKLNPPSKWATINNEPSLTEQEHKESCDINKMLKNLDQGQQVRGNNNTSQYGYDDTTLDGTQFRIQKEKLEEQLRHTAENQEFSEDELKHIPADVKSKFKFKTKAPQQPSPNDDDSNDNETAANVPPKKKQDKNPAPIKKSDLPSED